MKDELFERNVEACLLLLGVLILWSAFRPGGRYRSELGGHVLLDIPLVPGVTEVRPEWQGIRYDAPWGPVFVEPAPLVVRTSTWTGRRWE